MKNTIKKESRTLLLSCTVLAGIMTLWCIYSIIQGALSFIANPINGNVFESDELFWVLFIFGFPLSFILFNMTSYSVFNISSRGVEEDAMSGCLYTIIINIFIMPLFTTALIYYALWLLLEIALFLIPYIGALLLAGGVYLLYLACNQDKRALYDRWQKPGDKAKFKSIKDNSATPMSSRFVRTENTFSGESIYIGYEYSGAWIKKIGAEGVTFRAYMNDIFRVSSFKEERGTDYPF